MKTMTLSNVLWTLSTLKEIIVMYDGRVIIDSRNDDSLDRLNVYGDNTEVQSIEEKHGLIIIHVV